MRGKPKDACAIAGSRSSSGSVCDPVLALGGPQHPELRKNEASKVSARSRSKCSSVKDGRSGGATPRALSESPVLSAKCEQQGMEAAPAETPRSYLIKDFEADCRLEQQQQQQQPKPKATPTQSSSSPGVYANRFLSEVEEADWSYEGARLVRGAVEPDDPAGAYFRGDMEELQLDMFLLRDELRKLRGKAQLVEEEGTKLRGKTPHLVQEEGDKLRGKAPLAFVTDEDEQQRCTERYFGGMQEKCRSEDHLPGVPAVPEWFKDAYKTLGQLDEQDEASAGATSSSYYGAAAAIGTGFTGTGTGENSLQSKDSQPSSSYREDEEEEQDDEEEQQQQQQQQGPGWLWKLSLCASVSFVTWVLVNGAKLQCRSIFPAIREREQPVRIARHSSKLFEASREDDGRRGSSLE